MQTHQRHALKTIRQPRRFLKVHWDLVDEQGEHFTGEVF